MKRPRLLAPVLLAGAPLLFFHEIFLGRSYLLRDLFNWFYPWRTFTADSLARGDFPLWNPYSYAGTPFLANMQSGLLYPPNIVFWLFSFPTAMRLFLVIQFALAAWFMYLLLRAIGCRVASSLTGGLGYAYGGWMIVHIEFPNKLAAAAWLPLIVLGLVRWWQGRRVNGLLLGAFATACCVTAGYPQTTYTLLLGAGVIWCGELVAVARKKGVFRRARILAAAASMPSIVALGALVAAAQIVPFLDTLARSAVRQPYDPGQVLALGMSPWHFLDLISPHLFGMPGNQRYWGGGLYQFWLGHFHVGVLIAALALAGLLTRRTGAGRCAVLMALTGLFCLGDRTPLAPFCVAWLPGFSHFKWMSTTSILMAFALCWLAALGLDWLLEEIDGERRLPGWASSLALALPVAAVAAGLVAMLAPGAYDAMTRSIAYQVALPTQVGFIEHNLGPARDDAVRAGLVLGLVGAAWAAARAGRVKAAVFAALVPLAVFVDLKASAARLNFAGDPAIYRQTPPNVAWLASRTDPLFRVYVPDETLSGDLAMYGSENPEHFRWAANTLLFNLNLPWRLFSASDGDPLWSARWRRFHDLLEREGNDDARRRLLALANIGVILKGGSAGGTERVEVPAYLPRVYTAAGARRVAAGRSLDAMLEQSWDPSLEVLVEDDFTGETRAGTDGPVEPAVRRVDYTNNTVTIDVEVARNCYLVLSDTYDPGWKATIDAKATPVFTANHLFRGIDLPAGRHLVRFRYRPASVAWGAAGSAAGLLIAGAILIRGRRR